MGIRTEYLAWCKEFGIDPAPDWEKLIEEKYESSTIEPKYAMTEDRYDVLRFYKETCAYFKIKPRTDIKTYATQHIRSYVMRLIDNILKRRFASRLKTIKDPILRKKIFLTLQVLYDQGEYVIPGQTGDLFAAASDEQIRSAFYNLGGKGKLPEINLQEDEYDNIASPSEEEEDENLK